ncbi:MAG: dTMP kinase [Elusimicrobia bacterium]|nr:dTMP kinase [Elusimicrobiota bacterium]
MVKGFFLVFEGIDKCGKSSQARLLAERCKKAGLPVVLTREPGGTPLGERVRHLLLDFKGDVCPQSELLLYEASRAQHVNCVVKPALERGALVISDRFTPCHFGPFYAGDPGLSGLGPGAETAGCRKTELLRFLRYQARFDRRFRYSFVPGH